MNWKFSFCLVPSQALAEEIMHRLETERFSDGRISVVYPDKGALALPGIGAFIAAGPLVDSLSAGADNDAVSLASGLARLGMPEAIAQRYHRRIEGGCFLLSVHASTCAEADRAARIFAELGAEETCNLAAAGAAAHSAAA